MQNVYKDIKENGYPEENNKLLAILEEYPEFDVNIKSWHGNKMDYYEKKYTYTMSMLDIAFNQGSPQLVKAIIDNPNISKEEIERTLLKFQHFKKITGDYAKIKKILEDKLKLMREFEPSAPPLEAAPLQKEFQIRANVPKSLRQPSVVSDIQNLPNAPTHEPILLPDAPTKAILLPDAPTNASVNNAKMFSYI